MEIGTVSVDGLGLVYLHPILNSLTRCIKLRFRSMKSLKIFFMPDKRLVAKCLNLKFRVNYLKSNFDYEVLISRIRFTFFTGSICD